ncbi:hypothetical protein CH281_17100 [Rhodococcus sp. 06-221-2]|nr:hypothetical protein CH281_17100 [Rhodococcus sp. 06-221-2]
MQQIVDHLAAAQSNESDADAEMEYEWIVFYLFVLYGVNNLIFRPSYSGEPEEYVFTRRMEGRHLEAFPYSVLNLRDPLTSDAVRKEYMVLIIGWLGGVQTAISNHLAVEQNEKLIRALRDWDRQVDTIRRAYEDQQQRHIDRLIAEAESAAASATSAAAATQLAAGTVGADSLSMHFDSLSTSEQKSSFQWTITAMVALVASGVAAVILAVSYKDASLGTQALHLAWSLPLFAVAAYSARLANHHRLAARWAHTSAVQVKSVPAFLQLLNNAESRESVLLVLSTRLFSTPEASDDAHTGHMSIVPAETLEAIQKIASSLPRGSA